MFGTKTQSTATTPADRWQRSMRWADALPAAVILASDVGAFAATFLLTNFLIGVRGAPGADVQQLGILTPFLLWAAITSVSIIALAFAGHYAMSFLDAPTSMTLRGLGIVSFAALISIAASSFADPALSLHNTFGWMVVVPLLIAGRIFATLFLRFLSTLGIGTRTVLVIGSGWGIAYSTQKLGSHGVRHRFAGSVDVGNSEETINDHLDEVANAIDAIRPWEVLVAAPPALMARIEEAIRPFVPRSVAVRFAIYPLLDQPHAQDLDTLPGGLVTMRVRPDAPRARYAIVKRMMDIPIALIALLLLSPLMLAIAFAIKVDSAGPVLFRQTRVGREGRTFTMYKFRSMRMDAEEMRGQLEDANEAQGPLFKVRHDPRVTRVGAIIRRLSLDELPQFFNVLEGTMGVVGPRPALPTEVAEYEPWQLRRLAVLPGITGLWQVSRQQCSSFNEMIWLDIEYVEKRSPLLDLTIVLKTIPAMVTSKGAY